MRRQFERYRSGDGGAGRRVCRSLWRINVYAVAEAQGEAREEDEGVGEENDNGNDENEDDNSAGSDEGMVQHFGNALSVETPKRGMKFLSCPNVRCRPRRGASR